MQSCCTYISEKYDKSLMRIMCILIEHLEVDKRLELQKKVFTNCREYIVKHLNPDDIVDNLVSKHLIGDTACQQLCLPIKITQDKNRIIVNELSSGGPDTLEKFCAILNENSRIKHISDQLQKGIA